MYFSLVFVQIYIMLFKLNIRRRCSRLWYSTSVRSIQSIILLVIISLIVLLIKLRKKEDCWRK